MMPTADPRFVGKWQLTPLSPPTATIVLEMESSGSGRRIIGGTARHRVGEFRWWVEGNQLVVEPVSGPLWQVTMDRARYAYERLKGKRSTDLAYCTIVSVSSDTIVLQEDETTLTLQRRPQ